MRSLGATPTNTIKAGETVSVLGRSFVIQPFQQTDGGPVVGYDITEGGKDFLYLPWAPLSVYQIQELVASKIRNKPSALVKKENLLRRIWTSLVNPAKCIKCKSSIDRGHICRECFAAVDWPPLDKEGLEDEVSRYKKQSGGEFWKVLVRLDVLRTSLLNSEAEDSLKEWFTKKYPEKKTEKEPKNELDFLDRDPGRDTTIPQVGTESPQMTIPGLGLSDRLPGKKRR